MRTLIIVLIFPLSFFALVCDTAPNKDDIKSNAVGSGLLATGQMQDGVSLEHLKMFLHVVQLLEKLKKTVPGGKQHDLI